MKTKPSLTVLIIDDHDLVRAGVIKAAEQLAPDAVVLSAASIAEGIRAVIDCPEIDLVLLDLVLPDASGFSGLDAILAANPDVPVILLTADARRETMEQAFRKGASGYIPKSSSLQIITNALRIILAGGRYLPSEILQHTQSSTARFGSAFLQEATLPLPERITSMAHYGLTSRQLMVADLLRQGYSNKEIGKELNLGLSTVKTHVASILRALRTSSRTKALALLSGNCDFNTQGSNQSE